MAKEFGTGREFTFLRLNAKGELYISSKEPKEGFTEIIVDAGKATERKTYQKSYKSTDYGKVIFLGINEKSFDTGKVKYVELSIQSEDRENAVDVVQLPLKKVGGGITDEVKKLIAILPSLDYSKTIIVSSNREKNQRGYVDKVLYFRYKAQEGEEKDLPIKFSLKFGEKGNVPMFLVEEDELSPGSKTLNYKEQDAFLSKVLLYELKRYADFKEGNVYASDFYKEWETETDSTVTTQGVTQTTQPVAETAKVEENPFATGSTSLQEDSDLPF